MIFDTLYVGVIKYGSYKKFLVMNEKEEPNHSFLILFCNSNLSKEQVGVVLVKIFVTPVVASLCPVIRPIRITPWIDMACLMVCLSPRLVSSYLTYKPQIFNILPWSVSFQGRMLFKMIRLRPQYISNCRIAKII